VFAMFEACMPTIPNCRYCSATGGCWEQQCESGYGIKMLSTDMYCHCKSFILLICYFSYGYWLRHLGLGLGLGLGHDRTSHYLTHIHVGYYSV